MKLISLNIATLSAPVLALLLAVSLPSQARLNDSPMRGNYSEYNVHTLCIAQMGAAIYSVHIRTYSVLGEWKAKMDLSVSNTRGQSKILAADLVQYTQHTGGETFRSPSMRMELYYEDVSDTFPGAERGIFDATLPNGEALHFDNMSCQHE